MNIKTTQFAEFERQTRKTTKSWLDIMAPEVGKAYVVTITRDNCPACHKQKPRLERLAEIIVGKYGDRVDFSCIHVKLPHNSDAESLRSKDVFGHYFYPTNMIFLRTRDRGVTEYYRNISPRMTELMRNIEAASKTAKAIAEQTS